MSAIPEALAPGTRVHHAGQIWARSIPGGTAVIVRAEGPDYRGDYEYVVQTGVDFSRRTGSTNPETCMTRWSSTTVVPAKTTEAAR
jgi:hypothetical protein